MIDIQDLRAKARQLLANGEVRAVVGHRRGSRGLLAEPAVITRPEDAATLVWDPTCFHNLALYLVQDLKRALREHSIPDKPIAIMAKGCDARAIAVLMQENYFRRESIYILGVSCETSGMVDELKLPNHPHGPGAKVVDKATFDGEDFVLDGADGVSQWRLPAREVMADRCLECQNPLPQTERPRIWRRENAQLGPAVRRPRPLRAGRRRSALEFLEEPLRALHPLLCLPFGLPHVLLRRMHRR